MSEGKGTDAHLYNVRWNEGTVRMSVHIQDRTLDVPDADWLQAAIEEKKAREDNMTTGDKRYPTRMHEVLGVEPGERFTYSEYGDKKFWLSKSGMLCDDGTSIPTTQGTLVLFINHPERITRRPRMSEAQVKRAEEQEEREMTPEERLLKEIFAKSEQYEMPDNYPETYFEKADYAMHCMHKSLESISPALGRISRLCGLLRVSEKDGKNTLPDIITHNESRMALKHLTMVKRDVDAAYQEILSIFESANTKTESVGQGPEPGGEGKS